MERREMREAKMKLVEMAAALKLDPEKFVRGVQQIHKLTCALIGDNTPGHLKEKNIVKNDNSSSEKPTRL